MARSMRMVDSKKLDAEARAKASSFNHEWVEITVEKEPGKAAHPPAAKSPGATMQFNETHGLKVNRESLALHERAERIAGELRKQDQSLSAHAAYRRGLQKAREEGTPVEVRFNETAGLKVDRESLKLTARAEEIAADLRLQDRKLSEFAAFKEGLQRAQREAQLREV